MRVEVHREKTSLDRKQITTVGNKTPHHQIFHLYPRYENTRKKLYWTFNLQNCTYLKANMKILYFSITGAKINVLLISKRLLINKTFI